MKTSGEKIGIVASVVTIGGGIIWLFTRSGTPNITQVTSPSAAAAQQVAPVAIGSGAPIQQPWDNQGVTNYPSWNAAAGLAGNLPGLFVGSRNQSDPAYTTYNLPPNGTNLITSSPYTLASMLTRAAVNAGSIPIDLLNSLRKLWQSSPSTPSDTSSDCGCGCNDHKKDGCGGKDPCAGSTLYGSADAQAASYPKTYLSSTEGNTVSGLIPFSANDPRTDGATDTGTFE